MLRMPDGTVQIVVQGLERVEIGEFTQEKPYLVAHITVKPDIQEQDDETEAIKRNVISYFQRLVALVQNVPEIGGCRDLKPGRGASGRLCHCHFRADGPGTAAKIAGTRLRA